jgi:hypothetical protein
MKTFDEIDEAIRRLSAKYDENTRARSRLVESMYADATKALDMSTELFGLEAIGSALFSAIAALHWVRNSNQLYTDYVDGLMSTAHDDMLFRSKVEL